MVILYFISIEGSGIPFLPETPEAIPVISTFVLQTF